MKSLFTFMLFCIGAMPVFAQQSFCYSYDAAGNRIQKIGGSCAQSSLEAPPAGEQEIAEAFLNNLKAEIGKFAITGKIIPNPVNSTFSINLDGEPPVGSTFELYDALGRMITEQSIAGTSALFDVSKQSPGMSYLFLRINGKVLGKWTIVKQ